jgi:hypothetical protein
VRSAFIVDREGTVMRKYGISDMPSAAAVALSEMT